jgi:hypothetical protein
VPRLKEPTKIFIAVAQISLGGTQAVGATEAKSLGVP